MFFLGSHHKMLHFPTEVILPCEKIMRYGVFILVYAFSFSHYFNKFHAPTELHRALIPLLGFYPGLCLSFIHYFYELHSPTELHCAIIPVLGFHLGLCFSFSHYLYMNFIHQQNYIVS